ncbi:hypothetical protein DB895_07570, partial [Flavobacterium psychrotolerans]
AHVALTPAGNPLAPDTPALEIPVAPVVAWVIAVKGVLIHKVGVLDAAPAVFAATIVTVAVLLLAMALLQLSGAVPLDKFVIVIVVVPAFVREEVVNVPVPGAPAVKTIVAVFPTTRFGADRL